MRRWSGFLSPRSWLAATALALLVLVSGATLASASHPWATYHWARTSNPFTLKIVDSMTPAWDVYLVPVSADWSLSSVLDTPIEEGASDEKTRRRCWPIAGKVRACNASYGFNGWLGIARIWLSGSHIVQATTATNDSYFSRSPYNNANAKRHVLCQEIGHDLGLNHLRNGISCMNDRNGDLDGDGVGDLFDPDFVRPNAHDYEQLETIYAHLDSGSTISPSAAAAAFGPGDDDRGVSDFGTAVADGDGPATLFVKDLGAGRRVYTWVYWAKP